MLSCSVNMSQDRVVWKEGSSMEKMSPREGLVGKPVERFLD